MHGAAFANWAVNGEFEPRKSPADPMKQIAPGADLLLAFGVRFDDRVTGKVDKFCEKGTIVHLDIDPSEINKNKPANLPVISDIKFALGRLAEMIKERPIQKKFTAWHKQIEAWKAKAPFGYLVTEEVMKSQHMRDHLKGRENEVILPQMAIEMLYELTKGEAIITTGVGQHQMWAGQYLQVQVPAPVPDQRRPGRDGLRLSRRAGGQGGLPRPAGGGYRRRRLVPDEHPGAGHGAHREDRRQGDHPQQPAPGHGDAVGRPVLRGQPRQHLPGRPGQPASRFIPITPPCATAST